MSLTDFPTLIDTFPTVNAGTGDKLNTAGKLHDAQHNKVSQAVVAVQRQLHGLILNPLGPVYGVLGNGVANDATGLNTAYAEVEAAGGGVLWLAKPPVNYRFTADLNWTSNRVSVLGPGSAAVLLQAVGTAKINIRPSTFTVTQGPSIGGFTVQGDGSAPSTATGIYTGDITGFHFDDIVVQGFTGTGSIGVHVHTDTQTELNVFDRLHLNGNAINIKWTNSNPSLNSLARNNFYRCHINVNAGQIGWQMRDEVNLYTSVLNITGNMAGAGTFFDIGDTAQINGCFVSIGMEQTSGSGGTPYIVAAGAYVFGYGVARFEGFSGWTGALSGGARHAPGWRIMGPEAVVSAVDSQVDGQIANFLGSGNAANVHPLLWDNAQDPYATIGFMTGTNIRAPFVTMYDSVASAFIIYKIGSGAPNNLAEVMRVTNQGHVIVTTGSPATGAALAAAGTSPPAPLSSGNNASGTFSLGTGTTPTSGAQARFTFATAWPVAPDVVLGFLSGGCWDVEPIITVTTTYIEVVFRQVPAASQAVGTWAFSFHAQGSAT